ncbi:cell division protein FtsI (penicillin-binding protein 3) [Enteractinococcus coprophilus]|uniref:Cell division protein FtsI (Penicillin-binding protein 3) n=2 Tax=Enteractinococcus coprophilus TaxID=1027633 RepID=A0A543AJT4_9MICC|nr:cell division protein FtsI (penicillin-binding protein 3) [Enteractinococcus coprophilus]
MPNTPMSRVPQTRLKVTMVLLMVSLFVLGGRLLFIQGIDAEDQAQQAMDRRTRPVTLAPERGSILDRDGNVMAESVQRYDLVVDQRLVKDSRVWDPEQSAYVDLDIDEQLKELSEILDIDHPELQELMVGDRPYRIVSRRVTPEIRQKALDVGIPGLLSEPVAERIYPNGAVAGSILGFNGHDGHGLEGIERSQDEQLRGQEGQRVFEISADGVRIPNASFSETPAIDGDDIRLTIDLDVSWYAQEAIAAKVDQYNAKWGNIVVMDAKTGDILALADSETVDPTDPTDTDQLFWRPTALSQAFEPGSTGKAVTFAMALDAGVVTPEQKWTVPNKQTFNNEVISDSMPHDTYDMTTAGIFTRSYNTGTVQVAELLSAEQRWEYMKKFGIGEPIDLGISGMNQGQFTHWENWDRRQHFTTTFGQGYSLTSLHTTRIFQALANGGKMMPARLIDAYIDEDGVERTWESSEKPKQVVSEEAADEMLKLMEGVVQEGTAYAAEIDGYRVGGKTGTGEAAGAGGYDGYTTSFTGVVPLDDPQFVVSVAVHRPQGDWKTWQVTDTAADVMEYLLSKYSVPPSDTGPQNYDVFTEDPQERPW